MTDPNLPSGATPDTPRTGRAIKIVLAVSLALNLAVAGVVAGAALRGRGDDGPGRHMMARDVNFGPFTEALTRAQRRGMLSRIGDDGIGLRDMRAQMRGDMDLVIEALRAMPFDAAAVEAALALQSERLSARVDTGRKALIGLILAMSVDERAAFTDRLEAVVSRKAPPQG